MQVLCKSTNTSSDISCPLCGQGFLLYWERSSRQEQDITRRKVQQALEDQHTVLSSAEAHPQSAFNIPSWEGNPYFSGAALLGGLPDKVA
jgi:hypothetical protein